MKRASSRRALKRRQSTPTRLRPAGQTDGLVLRAGADGAKTDDVLRMVKRIVSSNLPGKWTVTPLGPDSRDFSVRRPMGTDNPDAARAFEFAYRLRLQRDVEDCEPALILPSVAPEELRSAEKRFSSSGIGGGDLSCGKDKLWALEQCDVPDAWKLAPPKGGRTQGDSIVVGHPDTGYTDHPQIIDGGRLLKAKGFDFEDGDVDARDTQVGFSSGHGTGTSSVIMSSAETEADDAGVTGVAPRAKLVPLRVTTSVVLLSFAKLAEAVRFAADGGHHVVSISLGGPIYSRFLHRAVQNAVEKGVIVVCAAGNVWPFVVYPARLDEVIAVAASNCQNQIWADSASGRAVDITAPGESVWRAETSGVTFLIGQGSGTSYATAIVAGAAALWLAFHGRENLIARFGVQNIPSVFKELLITRGFDRPQGWDTENFGSGILNVKKLLSAALPATSPAGGLLAVHASATPRAKNQLDEILELYPEPQRERVRVSLAKMLHVDAPRLTTALRDVGDEISYLAVTDMDFRKQFSGGTARVGALQSAVAARTRPMSRTLRQMIGGRGTR